MIKVKIGEKEYRLESLVSNDLKALEAKKKENKLSDYDYAHAVILHAIKKFNPDVKMTLDEFMNIFPLKGMEEKLIEIGEVIGLDFKTGIAKSETGEKK